MTSPRTHSAHSVHDSAHSARAAHHDANSVAEAVAQALVHLGIDRAFGLVGSGNFHFSNALTAAGIPFVTTRHEAGAVTMADAYARLTDRVGLVTVHQGCGLTNAVTGIAEAAKSRTPLLIATADTQAAAVRSNFRIDQDALAVSVGAVAERLHSPASALQDVRRAYQRALHERCTVVLSMPLDIQAHPADALDVLRPIQRLSAAPRTRASEQGVTELVDLLKQAQRPVFVAGRGARAYHDEILALAKHSGALVATSAVARGLFAEDPFSLDIAGGFSSPLTAELIQEADLLVAWGCSLNMWTTRHGRLISEQAKIVQIDHEITALAAHRSIHLGLWGDCGLTAQDTLSALQTEQPEPVTKYRTPAHATEIATRGSWRDVPTPDISTETQIDPRVLSRELDQILPLERVLSVDSGNFMGYPSTYLRVPDEKGFCFTQAFQSIGLGLFTALGASMAQPERLPVLAAGDAGFLMSIAELETAVRLKIPLVCIIYNDAGYGAEVHHFGPMNSVSNAGNVGTAVDMGNVLFPDSDFAALARGFGAEGLTVRRPEDLADVKQYVERWLANSPQVPLVIDAKIASDGGSWWLEEAFRGH